jgi:hypothetical protein
MLINIILSVILFLSPSVSSVNTDNEKVIVQQVVDTFYKNYKGDYSVADKNLIARPTVEKINLAVTHEIKDAKRLKELNSTDKPDLLEGDVFSGLNEGYTSFLIGEITFSGENAVARVHFVNANINNYSWYSDVVLVKENLNWKIYNVIYFKDKKESGSLLKTLFFFLDKKLAK